MSSGADLGTKLEPGDYFIELVDRKGCAHCGGPSVAMFHASRGGFSCGGGLNHKPQCPELRCAHGVLFAYACALCEAEEDAAVAQTMRERDTEDEQ